MSREYASRPLVGVGIVALKQDSVLLIRRRNPPRQGEWSLPGGAQELGETIAQAAEREMKEETGLIIEAGPVIAVVDMIDHDSSGTVRLHYTLIDVLGVVTGGTLKAGDDALCAEWVPCDQLPDLDLWQETCRVITLARGLAEKSDRHQA